ncbi:glycosyltransferase [Flavobacterium sp. P21]|uniref:glycosyltransferase n=1 Tax=Flavobacterium sp. P21 TaxID=3423948 RepID=UPI003D66B94B
MSLLNGRSKNWEIISNTSHFEMLKNEISFHNSHSKKFNNEVIKVFTVRSIEERALINLIIDVAEKLKGEKIEFFIAGKGPLLDFYRMKIESLGLDNISLLGYVSDKDLLYYYNTCNLVLVTAAYGEGFGLPIIEGYLFNKPVISSNVCAIPDVIVSKNFLFENNVDSIISKLDFVKTGINTDYKNYYDTYFSNEVIITKMNELYNKLF